MDMKKLREKAILTTKKNAKVELMSRDKLIVSSVKAIDTIDKTSNLLFEQAMEWFAIYYPEMKAQNIDDYLEKAMKSERPVNSMGADLKEKDMSMIRSYLQQIIDLRMKRKEIEEYLDSVMLEEAPNITAIVGSLIGARLISTAGGLKRLAEFPSSTVQVIGAEKALFAHLKKGVNPPKYGVIFSDKRIRGADKAKRGKVARKIAAKLSIASKVDFFKGEFMGQKLSDELDEDMKRL